MLAKNYIIQLRTILSNKGITEDEKCEIVSVATEGRTTSIRQMYTREAIALIKSLNGHQDDQKHASKKQKMKRKILALCHEMGWQTIQGKVDMKRVNAFCEKRGHCKKPFNDYTTKELPALVTQFEQLHKAYQK